MVTPGGLAQFGLKLASGMVFNRDNFHSANLSEIKVSLRIQGSGGMALLKPYANGTSSHDKRVGARAGFGDTRRKVAKRRSGAEISESGKH